MRYSSVSSVSSVSSESRAANAGLTLRHRSQDPHPHHSSVGWWVLYGPCVCAVPIPRAAPQTANRTPHTAHRTVPAGTQPPRPGRRRVRVRAGLTVFPSPSSRSADDRHGHVRGQPVCPASVRMFVRLYCIRGPSPSMTALRTVRSDPRLVEALISGPAVPGGWTSSCLYASGN
jgi:hypothetical protein